ncbi:hypothetical protein F5Y09DRAFT_342099 [Xylaria sp. FL1042]|nr:hypothetical protein F5Y09DRAFT_342099 [Xylaria sp. FL1042]
MAPAPPRQRADRPHNQDPQVDSTQVPAVAGAIGEVLTDGRFRCTRMDRGGNPTTTVCNSITKNEKANIRSHLNKIHCPHSRYKHSNGPEPLPCRLPRYDGRGACDSVLKGIASLVGHARRVHGLRGDSSSLTVPWDSLSLKQRVWYFDRIYLNTLRQQNLGVLTPVNQAHHERLKQEKIPEPKVQG